MNFPIVRLVFCGYVVAILLIMFFNIPIPVGMYGSEVEIYSSYDFDFRSPDLKHTAQFANLIFSNWFGLDLPFPQLKIWDQGFRLNFVYSVVVGLAGYLDFPMLLIALNVISGLLWVALLIHLARKLKIPSKTYHIFTLILIFSPNFIWLLLEKSAEMFGYLLLWLFLVGLWDCLKSPHQHSVKYLVLSGLCLGLTRPVSEVFFFSFAIAGTLLILASGLRLIPRIKGEFHRNLLRVIFVNLTLCAGCLTYYWGYSGASSVLFSVGSPPLPREVYNQISGFSGDFGFFLESGNWALLAPVFCFGLLSTLGFYDLNELTTYKTLFYGAKYLFAFFLVLPCFFSACLIVVRDVPNRIDGFWVVASGSIFCVFFIALLAPFDRYIFGFFPIWLLSGYFVFKGVWCESFSYGR